MAARHILAIDQGTTSTRAIVFDASGRPVASAQTELPQIFPKPGWVEHDPEEIWRATVEVSRSALGKAELEPRALAGIGITNQRETTVVWDRATGKPVHNAIVWQDRRTADLCEELRRAGHEAMVSQRTGLLLDPYFCGTKIAWILRNVAGARTAAEKGALAAGTIESFLLWRLTGGKVHASDATNASRTLLLDIRKGSWDSDLAKLLEVPLSMLPQVVDCAGELGVTAPDILGASVPVLGMAGDQQAATLGQACTRPGMVKATYGTGCFAVLNTGSLAIHSNHRLLTTIAYQLDGRRTYALEGSIFVAGAAVQWLRDGLNLIKQSGEVEAMARNAKEGHGVYMVPAFVGLGAPYWDAGARGALLGLTRDTGGAEIAAATLDSVCYQTRDLVEAMRGDGAQIDEIRVDGGMVVNDSLMQRLADTVGTPVQRPKVIETTSLGAAFLAGLQAGIWPSLDSFSAAWSLDRAFTPSEGAPSRDRRYLGWQNAVKRVRSS
ncbi:glycerol kinase GlpK [Enhydrobacter sp.]|jgi:glycerol kinase|uniref:glycerol kinase GlpK n=1 Tax=Enhydrobacter sp. TaxID=1894999 RepID=UPI00261482CD|nr:glycerol kinase GlpK [Enhydrobacter sp.]WIM11559.1 MAG: Glycerol kinase [Enhydrobacter sp.]